MILINSLNINQLSDKIEVNISTSVGNVFTKVLLWNSSTYKDTTQAIDVSALLNGTFSNEIFEIPASLLGVQNILGLWFLEFTTDETPTETDCCQDNAREAVVANLTPYHECILNRLLSLEIEGCKIKKINGDCGDCSSDLLFTSMLLDQLYFAISYGFYAEAIQIVKILDECCQICNSCPDYGTTVLLSGGGFGVFDNVVKLNL